MNNHEDDNGKLHIANVPFRCLQAQHGASMPSTGGL